MGTLTLSCLFLCFLATIKWADCFCHMLPLLPQPQSNRTKPPRIETSETMSQSKPFLLVHCLFCDSNGKLIPASQEVNAFTNSKALQFTELIIPRFWKAQSPVFPSSPQKSVGWIESSHPHFLVLMTNSIQGYLRAPPRSPHEHKLSCDGRGSL